MITFKVKDISTLGIESKSLLKMIGERREIELSEAVRIILDAEPVSSSQISDVFALLGRVPLRKKLGPLSFNYDPRNLLRRMANSFALDMACGTDTCDAAHREKHAAAAALAAEQAATADRLEDVARNAFVVAHRFGRWEGSFNGVVDRIKKELALWQH